MNRKRRFQEPKSHSSDKQDINKRPRDLRDLQLDPERSDEEMAALIAECLFERKPELIGKKFYFDNIQVFYLLLLYFSSGGSYIRIRNCS